MKLHNANYSYEPMFAVRITPFMLNRDFWRLKRGAGGKQAACIAFWGASTHKTGHLLPESLQRF